MSGPLGGAAGGAAAPVHLSPPDVGDLERELLLRAFDSGWVGPVGPDLTAFEQELAHVVGVPHAVALSSGTAALHLALQLAGVRRGDAVLVPTFTFAATANAVAYLGAEPVFVDSDPATWAVDPGLVAQALRAGAAAGRPPRAVVPVDVYGQCADLEALEDVCRETGTALVEDAAEALGSTRGGRAAGAFGHSAALSFNGNKIITSGGGGALLTSDEHVADRARHLATQAREPVAHYEHRDVGYNYRLSNLLAALGRAQLRTLAQRVQHRRAVFTAYSEALDGVPGLRMMPVDPGGRPNHWLSCVLLDPDRFGAGPEQVAARLAAGGVEARRLWKPLHLQPAYEGSAVHGGGVAEDLFARGLALPSGAGVTDEVVQRVVAGILSARRATAGAR